MKGFLLSPVETFQKVRDTDLGDSLKYYLILLVINAVLSAIVGIAMVSAIWMTFSGLFEQLGLPLPAVAGLGVVLFAILMIIVQFVMVFIIAAWFHLFVYLLGGRKGYLQTLKAVTFGSTPAMLFGWIPFIGMLANIWSIALEILGIRELQEMTTGKAALAVILAILVILIIVIAIAAMFFIAFSEITSVPVTGF
ncbi:MAG: YIP1 family protein [Methanoregulaceae archaeon]|nr:YIP1 family protein [Methanoregulaceae archaeon]